MHQTWAAYDYRRPARSRRGGRRRALARPDTLAAVLDPSNLYCTMLAMRSNNGQAPGIDGVRYGDLSKAELFQLFRDLRAAVLNRTYRPQPHKLVEIVKKGGGTRTLRLAVIADRILEKAVADAFGPLAERTFLDCIYGFRPRRNRFWLLAALKVACELHGLWVVTADDIAKAFDNVPVEAAVAALRGLGVDPDLAALAEVILRGHDSTKEVGIAQGGALSPLTLNTLLHYVLDAIMMAIIRGGHTPVRYYRYADNILVATATAAEGRELLERMRAALAEVGLTLKGDPGKPRDLQHGQHLDLLGMRLTQVNGKLTFEIPNKKWEDLQAKLVDAHQEPNPTAAARTLGRGWVEAHSPAFGNNDTKDEETRNRLINLLRRTGHRNALTPWKAKRLISTASNRWNTTVANARTRTTTESSQTTSPLSTTPTTANTTAVETAWSDSRDQSDGSSSRTDATPTDTDSDQDAGTDGITDTGTTTTGEKSSSRSFSVLNRPSGRVTAPPDRHPIPCGANHCCRAHHPAAQRQHRPHHSRRTLGRPSAARPPPS